jgi:hypothetical protein
MVPLRHDARAREPLVEYQRPDGETLELSLARAFERVDVDAMSHEEPLQNRVDVDALRRLHDGSAAQPVRTTLRIEGHPVTVTADAIVIHPETA